MGDGVCVWWSRQGVSGEGGGGVGLEGRLLKRTGMARRGKGWREGGEGRGGLSTF